MSDGEQHGLAKSMGLVGSLFITISCISPSIAVFIVGSDTIKQVGTAVVPCFGAAAIFGLVMCCVYGELGSAFPSVGGEYSIFRKVFAPPWSRGVLGLNLLGFSMSLALSGYGVATYLGAIWPGLPARPLAAMLVLLVTILATLHIQVGAAITGAFLLMELLALIVLGVLGAEHLHYPISTLVHPAAAALSGGMTEPTIGALGAATAAGIYAFNGYGAAIFFSDDMRDARRQVAPVVLLALFAGVLMVMPPLALVILGAPNLHDLFSAPAPITMFVQTLAGERLSRLMNLGVGLAVFNTMIAIALMGARQFYATGRDCIWPGPLSAALARTHARWGSPWVSTLAIGACGLLACLLDPHKLVLILGNSNVITYSGLCLAAWRGRRTGASNAATWRMPVFPAPALLGLVFLVGVAVVSLFDPSGRIGLGVSVVTFGASIILFRGVERGRFSKALQTVR